LDWPHALRMFSQEHHQEDKVDAFNAWMYKGGHPNWLATALNRVWGAMWAAGLSPSNWSTLEVRGRKSGRPISLPVVVVDYEGERYLVSMLGEGAGWVANVRAAGGEAVIRHGNRTPVRLEEINPGARAPILKRYLEIAPGPRAHIPVDRTAPLAEFAKIAARYPVFRINATRQ
jgi:deazaflavin-dependent oxidoreductase (nitroreductase family)